MVEVKNIWWTIVGYGVCVAAHGAVQNVTAEGITLDGFAKTYYNNKQTPAWKIPLHIEGSAYGIGHWGPLNGTHYKSPHINCHLEATPGDISLEVKAGNSVKLQWSAWPTSHHGPIIDYLANCNGKCEEADPTKLKFNKIAEMGLISTKLHKYDDEKWPTTLFAADKLIKDKNLWTVKIPSFVAPGNYVLRHETIALHNSWTPGGAQHIPQCINLKVVGSGTDKLLSGTRGTDLYSTSQPGLGVINIYMKPPMSYAIPGPPLYKPEQQDHSTTKSGPSVTTALSVTTAPSVTTALFSNSTVAKSPMATAPSSSKVAALSSYKATAPSYPNTAASSTQEATAVSSLQAMLPSSVALSVSPCTSDVVPTSSYPVVTESKTSVPAQPDSSTSSQDLTAKLDGIQELLEKIAKLFGELQGLLD